MSSPLIPRLKRELARNYKKTVILGIVCLIAIYFWAPLVTKWAFPDQPVAVTPPSPESMVAVPTTSQTGEPEPAVTMSALPRWDLLLAARQEDARAKALQEVSDLRNPFRAVGVTDFPQPEVAQEKSVEPEIFVPKPEANIDPESAGVVVTATVLGNRPSALINGYRYNVGDRLVVRKLNADPEDPARDLVFEITKITGDAVVLSHDGTEFPLHLQKSNLAQGDWMKVRSPAP